MDLSLTNNEIFWFIIKMELEKFHLDILGLSQPMKFS